MAMTDLKELIERVAQWPEEARHELLAVAYEIERELNGQDYVATSEELTAIDAAVADIDSGHIASEAEVQAAFAKFRQRG